jgi:hypothetical protein
MAVEALKTWVVPVAAVAVAAAFGLASALGAVDEAMAVYAIAAAVFAWSMFASYRRFFFSEDATTRNVSIAFTAAWTLFACAKLWMQVFPGAPLGSGSLAIANDEITLPEGSRYSIVVDGHFKASQGQGNRVAGYHLEVDSADGAKTSLDGNFRDVWARQRLGRRGSTNVEIQRTSVRHQIQSPGAPPVRLKLVSLDAAVEPPLAVHVYPGSIRWLVPVAATLAIAFALALEKWLGGDGAGLMAVAVSGAVLDQYLRWGSPHVQLRDLIGAVLVGGVIGAPLAALLWRFVPARWFAFGRRG